MTAALHRDFLRLAVDNALTRPGGATMLGTPVDLARLDTDTYVVAGVADHICPWQSCYRSTQLLGGRSRFVLSTSGHIAVDGQPAGERQGQLPDGARQPPGPRRLAGRGGHRARLLVARLRRLAGAARRRRQGPAPAPRRRRPPPMEPAPGTYVLDR